MKKNILISSLLFILLNLGISKTQATGGNSYYVASSGNDSNPGTKESPWKTINYAVGKSPVKAGDTILVEPGTYTEIVNLDKSGNSTEGHITLKANGLVTIVDPTPTIGNWREGVIQSAGKGYWVIDGFRIEKASWAAIALRDANNMIVQNNHTYESGASGIIVMPDTYFLGGEQEVTSKNIKVLNNTIEKANWRWWGNSANAFGIGTQEALSIWGVDGFEVAYNTLTEGKREGIDAKTGSRNGSIHHNTVTKQALLSGTYGGYHGGPAIYLEGNRAKMFNIHVHHNIVFGNTADGIVVADEVPAIGDVSDIQIYNNLIYSNGLRGVNGGMGIKVGSNVRKVTILNNTVAKNVQAFVVDGDDYNFGGYRPNSIVARNNIFADSTYRHGYLQSLDYVIVNDNIFASPFLKEPYENKGGIGLNFWFRGNKTTLSANFVDLENNNFRLQNISPAVDFGVDFTHWLKNPIQTDLDGNIRKIGLRIDAGAYELIQN
jgi:hypothetical protein